MKTKTLLFQIILSAGILGSSCEDLWNRCADGNGNIVTRSMNLDDFNSIQIKGSFDVEVDTGQVPSADIEIDENLLDQIVTHVTGSTLYIETRDQNCLNPTQTIYFHITAPAVNEIALYGSGNVSCDDIEIADFKVYLEGSGNIECNNIVTEYTTLNLEGSGTISCDLNSGDLNSIIEGSGNIVLTGTTVNAGMEILGSGSIEGSDMISDTCTAYLSGSGTIETYVNDFLDVTIIGSGIIYYSGNPVVQSYISGSGQVIKQ